MTPETETVPVTDEAPAADEAVDNDPVAIKPIVNAILRIGSTSYDSLDEYRAAAHAKLNGSKPISTISPFAILGFTSGSALDFKLYESLGFDHPRPHNYYNLAFDDNGSPTGDPAFV